MEMAKSNNVNVKKQINFTDTKRISNVYDSK